MKNKNSLTIVLNKHIIVLESTHKEVDKMSDKEREILDVFKKLVPVLTDFEKEKLLAFGEGMAFKAAQQQEGDTPIDRTA